MKIGKVHSWKKVTAQLLLLVLPTALLAFYLLWNVNHYYAILHNDWRKQGLYVTAGLVTATLFYSYRFRFITTAAVLFLFYYIGYKTTTHITVGEFDTFFASIQFLLFAILFSLGWITGYGFSRSRYYTLFWSLFLLGLQIVVVSKTGTITAASLISAFVPVLAYAVYIIYTAELIRNMNEDEKGFAWFVTKRITGFAVVLALLLLSIFAIFNKDFKAIEKEWGGSEAKYDKNKSNSESMTKENRDGSISNKDQTQLTGSLNKGKRLVFVARLDNFFPDGKTPNPLYFTAYYYTKFDTLTQTFETDSLMPSNDLFRPDPSKIPLYFAKADSNVIKNTRATKARKIVNAEVYKTLLSPSEFVAPSTAFFCQPLPVENAYKDQYKSAYRAKMWVSDLNSAYFIYNPAGNQTLESFQQQRFDVLRQVPDFSGIDNAFLKYYTYMSKDPEYDRIRALAQEITKNARTPVDKIIAIRDYFLGKDEFGQPLFKYSNNPGIPGLPSANKLTYFLFENRKGYCAYFAGATLFLLRALGIPSRVAAGFLTVDRSSKNPGWYWFYEDQAHAWVQVYFPGYGWIDFDTTVPDTEAQQSPQPDGTPPLNMQQAYLVADGKVVSVDTTAKKVQMTVEKLLFHDQNYETTQPSSLEVDASLATVSTDTGTVRLSALQKDMHITAASFAEALKNMQPQPQDNISSVLKRIPKPTPVDEIKIIEEDKTPPARKKDLFESAQPVDWIRALWITLLVIAIVVLLAFASPWLIWQYLNQRAKASRETGSRLYHQYRAAMYYLNQLGYYRNQQGPQQYAQFIDARFGTDFTGFNQVYQKQKYSTLPFTEAENATVAQFYRPFIQHVRKQTPFKTRVSKFLNIYNTIHYFTQPKIS
jgi:transglutaminase-like putative cysteine protease